MACGELGRVILLVVKLVEVVKNPEQGNATTQRHQVAGKTVLDPLLKLLPATLMLAQVT